MTVDDLMKDPVFADGLERRRSVLGPDYVDRSISQANDFTIAFQDLTTRWCWGEVWGDDTLCKKTRSLMNLVMLTALGKPAELKLHVLGALNNGVSVEEIRAALVHATVYCGIPAGLEAFKIANEVLTAQGHLS